MAASTRIAQLRSADTDYPLRRDVARVLGELNPTSVLTRNRADLWRRTIVDHASTAFVGSDGRVQLRSMSQSEAGRGERPRFRQGAPSPAGARVANDQAKSASGKEGRNAGGEHAGDDDDDGVNPTYVKLRAQQTRRADRQVRAQLRKSLVQSERRVKLCKNGVQDPYTEEHVALWDDTARRRAQSALALPAIPRKKSKKNLEGAKARSHTPGVGAASAAEHVQLGRVLPPPPATMDAPDPLVGEPQSMSATGVLPQLRGASPTSEPEFGVLEASATYSPNPATTGGAEEADPGSPQLGMTRTTENATSFFFTQPSFNEAALRDKSKSLRLLPRLESVAAAPASPDSPRQSTVASPSASRAGGDALASRPSYRGEPAARHSSVTHASAGQQGQQAHHHAGDAASMADGRSVASSRRNRRVGAASKSQATSDTDQLASAAEVMRLRKKFQTVPAQQMLTRNYRPPSPSRPTVTSPEKALASKLTAHPKFQLQQYEDNERFIGRAQETLTRKNLEQRSKFDKKYRALDVGGKPLPFHATPAAILHHVEAVIERDERATSRQDAYERHIEQVEDIRAYLRMSSVHPKVQEMIDFTARQFSPDRAEPGPDVFFEKAMGLLEDSDFLFHDLFDACVHIATAYKVDQQEVIAYARSRAARFIHDQPAQLLARMEATDRKMGAAVSDARSPSRDAAARSTP